MSDTFIQQIADHLTKNLPLSAQHAKLHTYGSKNCIRVYYPEFDSSYYEVALVNETIEITFNFTGGSHKNASRLALFENHLYSLRQKLGHQFVVNPTWQTGWARVAILLPKAPLTAEQAKQAADLMLNFLGLTYPILRSVFEAIPARKQPARSLPTLNPEHYGAYALLSQHLDKIRAFLQGKGNRPPDDVLCDWLQFCYTFELYKEGAELFNLIDETAVQPWLYGRARRLATVCRIRAKLR